MAMNVAVEMLVDGIMGKAESVINQSSAQRMRTELTLQRSGALAGQLDAVTRTWTGIKMRGFTGGVYVLLRHTTGAVIGVTGLHTFGVDGKWVGRADRTEFWQERITPSVAAATVGVEIIQLHTPRDRYNAILAEIVDKAQRAKEAASQLGLGD